MSRIRRADAMKLAGMIVISAVIVFISASATVAGGEGRIYGKLTTVNGEVFEGPIRWDLNEGSWVDILNGTKQLTGCSIGSSRKKYGERKKSIKIFGLRIEKTEDYSRIGSALSGIRFGHIKTLEVLDDNEVIVTLKSGEEVELRGNSSDIGGSIREIVIEDIDEGEIEFDWDDIERIDFMAGTDIKSNYGERLYGTLITRRGDEFTGWVCWDVDEMFEEDILDGKEKRRNRKIEFGKISAIERYSSSSALVILKSGDELALKGTNDVDDDNRGIIITDVGLGQVVVDWDDFERLEFQTPPSPVKYDEFDGGRQLKGTVYTEDGESYTGKICWDADEQYTWEILDGEYYGIELDIDFAYIQEIKRRGRRSSTVTLWDGRSFRLKGTNDVNDDNKGIFVVEDGGEEVIIDWDEFDRIEFAR
jgi:hypothetical protein